MYVAYVIECMGAGAIIEYEGRLVVVHASQRRPWIMWLTLPKTHNFCMSLIFEVVRR